MEKTSASGALTKFHHNQELSDLAALVAPLDAREFLETCWGKSFRRIPGRAGKFAALLPWPVLNQILEQHRLDPPRLRLTREGKPVPPTSYIAYKTNRRKSGAPIPRLLPAQFTRELREGATLVLDAVDELHRPITDLAESLERIFHVRVQVNAYAGWRTSHGFDLHWDDHDVFIVQVAGRKQWKVYGMTRKYPLPKDVERAVTPPRDPLWEGMLEDGDLLYIPRGWWHVATPLDEPTLHLTVGVNNPTGSDLLTWFADRLRAHEQVRKDLPRFAAPEEQLALMEDLRRVMMAEWEPDLLHEYFAGLDATSQPRARFHLPWDATPEVLPPGDNELLVKWSSARPAAINSNGSSSEVVIAANGRIWKFATAARPLLDTLLTGAASTIEDLRAASNNTLEVETIRTFLKELAAQGLIRIVEPRRPLLP